METNVEQGTVLSESDLSDLTRFFPQADVRSINEIESFHSQMKNVLAIQFDEERKRLTALIERADAEVMALESSLKALGVPATLSKTFLDKYTKLAGKIDAFEKQNAAFLQARELRDDVKIVAEQLAYVEEQELRYLQSDINNRMSRLNDYIYKNETHKPPIIDFTSIKKYYFITPDDTGTGTSFKSLVVFDLSILGLTQLPALAHDSPILKNIGDAPIEKIMQLYAESDKQVFIALDKDDSYSERTSSMLNNSAVLRLSGGKNQLFGFSWNVKQGG